MTHIHKDSQTPRAVLRAATRTVACALITAALACAAGCSGGQHAAGSAARPSASLPAALSCEAAVLRLLADSVTAAEDGYPDGLSPLSVMDRYGEQSAVFQVWSQFDGQVLAALEQAGPDGVLTPFVRQVARGCAQYAGQPQQGSPSS